MDHKPLMSAEDRRKLLKMWLDFDRAKKESERAKAWAVVKPVPMEDTRGYLDALTTLEIE